MLYIVGDPKRKCYLPGELTQPEKGDVTIIMGDFAKEINHGCSGRKFQKMLDYLECHYKASFCFLDCTQRQIPDLYRYPRITKYGSLVYKLRGNVFHLIRGHAYDFPDADGQVVRLTCYQSGYEIADHKSLKAEKPDPEFCRLLAEQNKVKRERRMMELFVAQGCLCDKLKSIDIENYKVRGLLSYSEIFTLANARRMAVFNRKELELLMYYYSHRKSSDEQDMFAIADCAERYGYSQLEVIVLIRCAVLRTKFVPLLKRRTCLGEDEWRVLCPPQEPPATNEERAAIAEDTLSYAFESASEKIMRGDYDTKLSAFDLFSDIRKQLDI